MARLSTCRTRSSSRPLQRAFRAPRQPPIRCLPVHDARPSATLQRSPSPTRRRGTRAGPGTRSTPVRGDRCPSPVHRPTGAPDTQFDRSDKIPQFCSHRLPEQGRMSSDFSRPSVDAPSRGPPLGSRGHPGYRSRNLNPESTKQMSLRVTRALGHTDRTPREWRQNREVEVVDVSHQVDPNGSRDRQARPDGRPIRTAARQQPDHRPERRVRRRNTEWGHHSHRYSRATGGVDDHDAT